MAKKAPRSNRKQPHLHLATFCTQALIEKDEVMSLIRIVDRFIIPGTEKKMVAGVIQTTAVISLKSGEARGKRTLTLITRDPNEKEIGRVKHPIVLREHGCAIVAPVIIPVKETGTYWIEVLVNTNQLTKMPLEVCYRKVAIPRQAKK